MFLVSGSHSKILVCDEGSTSKQFAPLIAEVVSFCLFFWFVQKLFLLISVSMSVCMVRCLILDIERPAQNFGPFINLQLLCRSSTWLTISIALPLLADCFAC